MPDAERDVATCGATDWAVCDDGLPHVYGICEREPGNHWHREMRDGRLWAEWSDDSGPIPPGPWCEHTRVTPPEGHDHEKCCSYLRCAHPACCGYYGEPRRAR